jgi:chromosome partitioning protein
MTKRLGIINYKGGMGKTSLVVHLAMGLALNGQRVLVVDMDPQGSVKAMLGVKASSGTYELLVGKQPVADCITPVRDGLDIIASDERLFPASMQMVGFPNREFVLHNRLETVHGYDYILIDSGPSFDLLAQNAMIASQNLMVPISMDFMSVVGAKQLLKNVKLLNRLFDQLIQVQHVVPTFYAQRQAKTIKVMAAVESLFGPDKIRVPIRSCADVSNAAGVGQTVFEYKPKSRVIPDYNQLLKAVMIEGDNE